MKNPLAKLAVAAAVVVACILGLFMWTGTQSSVALADVLTRLQQVSVYMYQMSMTTTGSTPTGRPLNGQAEATALFSDELGMKMTIETDRLVPDAEGSTRMVQEMYMLPAQRRMVTIMPGEKKYMQMDFDDARFEEQRRQNNDPRAMVEQLLNCDYVRLGRSTIDGIEVEGFQTTDPNYMGSMIGQVDAKIWVDVKTQLPVRSEMDVQMTGDMHMHAVIHDFAWDISVDASEFEPIIPEDYTTLTSGPVKIPAMNEETAIRGLKLFAEMSGRYPEKLDMVTLMSVMKEFTKTPAAEKVESGQKPSQEQTQELLEKLTPVLSIGSFYTILVQDQKHPAYYGDIVSPEDAGQVLMRWQVTETEYRVIFGSLHAETVGADVLVELEKALPKP